jgi:hypothetical protein
MFVVLESLDEGQRGRSRVACQNTYRTSIFAILVEGELYPSTFREVGDLLICNRDWTCFFNGTKATEKVASFFISYWTAGVTTK